MLWSAVPTKQCTVDETYPLTLLSNLTSVEVCQTVTKANYVSNKFDHRKNNSIEYLLTQKSEQVVCCLCLVFQ